MEPQDTLESRLQNLRRGLGAEDQVVNNVMAGIAKAEFSPSPRAIRRRKMVLGAAVALGACAVAVMMAVVPGGRGSRLAQTTPGSGTRTVAAGTQGAAGSARGIYLFAMPFEQVLLWTAKWGYIDPDRSPQRNRQGRAPGVSSFSQAPCRSRPQESSPVSRLSSSFIRILNPTAPSLPAKTQKKQGDGPFAPMLPLL